MSSSLPIFLPLPMLLLAFFLFFLLPRPPISTLFPYTTLFRSDTSVLVRAWRDGQDLRIDVSDNGAGIAADQLPRSEEHTSELQSLTNLVCRLLLEKKKKKKNKKKKQKKKQTKTKHTHTKQ